MRLGLRDVTRIDAMFVCHLLTGWPGQAVHTLTPDDVDVRAFMFNIDIHVTLLHLYEASFLDISSY